MEKIEQTAAEFMAQCRRIYKEVAPLIGDLDPQCEHCDGVGAWIVASIIMGGFAGEAARTAADPLLSDELAQQMRDRARLYEELAYKALKKATEPPPVGNPTPGMVM